MAKIALNPVNPLLRPLALLLLALGPASAGVFTVSSPFTSDASSLISPANTYTHAISGGTAATVNGVNFEQLSSFATPLSFSWSSTGLQNEIIDGNGEWNPAAGGVTGTGLVDLLESFTYASLGADPGQSQTFTLSGLTPGTTYETRLYMRVWDLEASGRPIDLTFTHGTESNLYSGLLEDRPGTVLGTNNQHHAYFLEYEFTARANNLVIDATVPATAPVGSGSFHLYALTNQVIPEPSTTICLALGLSLLGTARRRS